MKDIWEWPMIRDLSLFDENEGTRKTDESSCSIELLRDLGRRSYSRCKDYIASVSLFGATLSS
jgi:hypothetical protein